ncbi:uncharacterized protein [Diadema setosum]|uniref:uncharacterized protein n=1 Tax=Diadema setosum TaxID=31175 RepID=UPI003B3BB140
MEEEQWTNLKKHLAVYTVEVYCCKLCNDYSSTHKSLMATHLHTVHPDDLTESPPESKVEATLPTATEGDAQVVNAADDMVDSDLKEDGSSDFALARQVAENEQIEKTILQILQTNSDISVQAAGQDGKAQQREDKENKRSKKSKKKKKGKKQEQGVPKRKNRKTCKLCDFSTKESDEFKAHLEKHYADPSSRTCQLCVRVFKTYKELMKHTRRGCPPGRQVYKCDECGKTCNDKRAIMEHMVVHSEDRPYACRVCGKTYKTKKILRRHEGIHAMERDTYQCPECAFKTHWKTNIKRHILEVHKKDTRPLFSCTHCPFTTPNKRYIEKHKFGHWKDCPYMCETCGKMFKAEQEMEAHKQTHAQPDIAWQLIQLQNSEPQLVEETIVQYQPHIQMHTQEIQIHDHDSNLQPVQVTINEQDEATGTIVLSQIPVVQYLDIVSRDVVEQE